MFFGVFPQPSLGNKLAARYYVAERSGYHVLPRLVWAGGAVGDLVLSDVPPGRYLLKANHAPLMSRPLTLPDEFEQSRADLDAMARTWLARNFRLNEGEWLYSGFEKKIFLEALDPETIRTFPDTYRMLCFHGEARLINVYANTPSGHQTRLYTPAWIPLPGSLAAYPDMAQRDFPRPAQLNRLIETAQAIARDLPFARVDLVIDPAGHVRFADLVLTPWAGLHGFLPLFFDRMVGAWFQREI